MAVLIAIAWRGLVPGNGKESRMSDITWFRVGAGLLAFLALGFGIPAAIGAVHFARTHEVWRLWGFPTYAPDVFQRWGVRAHPSTLMVSFAVVCGLAVVASVLLWIPATATVGAIAGILLIVVQAVFWCGFVLPVGPPGGLLAAVAIIVGLVLRIRG